MNQGLFQRRRGPGHGGCLPSTADVGLVPAPLLVRGFWGVDAQPMSFWQICSEERFCKRGRCLRMCAVFPAVARVGWRTPWLLGELSTNQAWLMSMSFRRC